MVYSDTSSKKLLLTSFIIVVLLLGGAYTFYGDQMRELLKGVNLLGQVTAPNESFVNELQDSLAQEHGVTLDYFQVFSSFIPNETTFYPPQDTEAAIALDKTQKLLEDNGVTSSVEELREAFEQMYPTDGPALAADEAVSRLLTDAGVTVTAEDRFSLLIFKGSLYALPENYHIDRIVLQRLALDQGVSLSMDDLFTIITQTIEKSQAAEGAAPSSPFTNELLGILSNHQLSSNKDKAVRRAQTTQEVIESFIKHEL